MHLLLYSKTRTENIIMLQVKHKLIHISCKYLLLGLGVYWGSCTCVTSVLETLIRMQINSWLGLDYFTVLKSVFVAVVVKHRILRTELIEKTYEYLCLQSIFYRLGILPRPIYTFSHLTAYQSCEIEYFCLFEVTPLESGRTKIQSQILKPNCMLKQYLLLEKCKLKPE